MQDLKQMLVKKQQIGILMNKIKVQIFDPEFMFGEKEKFDIVIGNPPYIRHEK